MYNKYLAYILVVVFFQDFSEIRWKLPYLVKGLGGG